MQMLKGSLGKEEINLAGEGKGEKNACNFIEHVLVLATEHGTDLE